MTTPKEALTYISNARWNENADLDDICTMADRALASLEGDAVERVARAVTSEFGRMYKDGMPIRMREGETTWRTYYAGLDLSQFAQRITGAILATGLVPDEAVKDTYLVGGADLKAMSGDIDSDRVIKLHFRRRVTDKDRERLLDAINLKIKADQDAVAIRSNRREA